MFIFCAIYFFVVILHSFFGHRHRKTEYLVTIKNIP